MKKMLILLALLGLSATGCVQMHMDTTITKDGSGTVSMSYGMSPTVAEALKEMAELPGNEASEAPTLDDFDQSAIEAACRKHDCKLKKFEMNADKTQASFEIEFSSLENLSKAMTDGDVGNGGGFALYKTADGNYTIDSYEYESAEAVAEEEAEEAADLSEMDPEAMQKGMAIMGKMMAAINELDVQMKITVPGEILDNNAHRIEGNTLIWEVNAENMMQVGGDMEPHVVFSGKGLDLPALPAK